MPTNKISTICILIFVMLNLSCSPEKKPSVDPMGESPVVNMIRPIDADGIINMVEADAVVVEGNSTLEDGYIVTVQISDGQNTVAGTAVVQEENWVTGSISISGFNNGEITVKAHGTNEAGNLSNIDETTLHLDQESPKINITGPIAGNDKIDSDEATAVVVSGTSDVANDQVVLITFGDENLKHLTTETKVNNGQWRAEIDVNSLTSGALMLMAEVSDVGGNPATVQRSGVVLE